MNMLFMMMTIMAFIFMWLNHPISMGIMIIMQTLTICMITGLMLGTFWFSYLIMITMLSGMLVLFIYMASVASNEKFFTSMKLIMFSMFMIMVGMIMEINNIYMDNEFMKIITSTPMESISLTNMFNMKFKFITMTMVMFLFFTMFTVSLIVNISEGPLRVNKK
uniref:NADH dehydrogenase subunit 6 n=1 Tax=Aeschyntelus notatus TaxID=498933 RepID=B7SM85_9HEMI|nr:NADH dehydrogenase subunit 6 [Aeschyntelus notatus]ABZ01979.1 NADH dehydrogenase subunit 6 [Aeschyntelus notatus]